MIEIKNYEGLYSVTSDGKVFSHAKKKYIFQEVSSGGVIRVQLYRLGKRKNFSVHRLVAEAFVPNPDNKEQVDHIDGNRLNNHKNNLRWCTNQENQDYRVSQGNSGREFYNNSKVVIYDGVEYGSIKLLSRKLASERNVKVDTVRKNIQRARHGECVVYGKSCIIKNNVV